MTHSAPRLATRADLPAVLAIYNASVPTHMSTADLTPQLMPAREAWWEQRDHATRPVLVSEDAGRVIAWGAFTNFKDRPAYAPTAEVSIYVDPKAVGRGVGRALLDALLARTTACRIDRVVALCFGHNEASLRLFGSRGFEEWGRMPDACNMQGVRRTVVMLGKIIPPAHS
ncbi:MAG: N-acetyltransferase family protein [Planctomycetota bacterium]|nr:MAG: N-acetyltransferase family protein [Planctomycetota bacterium]